MVFSCSSYFGEGVRRGEESDGNCRNANITGVFRRLLVERGEVDDPWRWNKWKEHVIEPGSLGADCIENLDDSESELREVVDLGFDGPGELGEAEMPAALKGEDDVGDFLDELRGHPRNENEENQEEVNCSRDPSDKRADEAFLALMWERLARLKS